MTVADAERIDAFAQEPSCATRSTSDAISRLSGRQPIHQRTDSISALQINATLLEPLTIGLKGLSHAYLEVGFMQAALASEIMQAAAYASQHMLISTQPVFLSEILRPRLNTTSFYLTVAVTRSIKLRSH